MYLYCLASIDERPKSSVQTQAESKLQLQIAASRKPQMKIFDLSFYVHDWLVGEALHPSETSH
jgi:hypothetical protein